MVAKPEIIFGIALLDESVVDSFAVGEKNLTTAKRYGIL